MQKFKTGDIVIAIKGLDIGGKQLLIPCRLELVGLGSYKIFPQESWEYNFSYKYDNEQGFIWNNIVIDQSCELYNAKKEVKIRPRLELLFE